jgi:hypothetical protein
MIWCSERMMQIRGYISGWLHGWSASKTCSISRLKISPLTTVLFERNPAQSFPRNSSKLLCDKQNQTNFRGKRGAFPMSKPEVRKTKKYCIVFVGVMF